MKRVNSQSESLDLTERKSPTKGKNPLIIGASTDDVLAMLETGLLIDPRFRVDANSAPKQFLASPLPVFRECVESWFESEVDARETPGKPVALVVEASASNLGIERGGIPLALPSSSVNEVVFRSAEESERFRDLLLQFRLDNKLGRIEIRVDSGKFGLETEDSKPSPL